MYGYFPKEWRKHLQIIEVDKTRWNYLLISNEKQSLSDK